MLFCCAVYVVRYIDRLVYAVYHANMHTITHKCVVAKIEIARVQRW